MNKLPSLAALVAAALIGSLSTSARSEDATLGRWMDLPEDTPSSSSVWQEPREQTPASSDVRPEPRQQTPASSNVRPEPREQTPVPASAAAPAGTAPPVQGGYAQPWQQPPQWRVPQQGYGYFPPRFAPGGQYPGFPAATATARENPLSAELKQAQEQLTAKSSELDKAHSMLEELRGKLQDNLAAEAKLSDKIAYSTREQQALRVRVTELTTALNTANATLEQQHQLINNHQAQNRQLTEERDQLHSALAGRDEQLAALQSELQAAMQALAQTMERADAAVEALGEARVQVGVHRDEMARLAAELERRQDLLKENTGSAPIDP